MSVINVTDDTFEAEVLNSPVPFLAAFFVAFCGPCKQMKPILHEVADELEAKTKIVAIDAIENQAISTTHSVTVVPTLIVFKNGEITGRLVGLQPKEKLAKLLKTTR